jgi:DNA-binding MarR family transcriptional regulator
MRDFVESKGNVYVAHRLRRSSDRIVEQCGEVLITLDIDVPPRGSSMMLLIDEEGPIGIVEVSRRLRLSHPLIVRMARRFTQAGLATLKLDSGDGRRRLLAATAKGREQAAKIRAFNSRLATVFDSLFAEIDCPLIAVLERLDRALEAVPIAERLSATS